QQVLPMVAATAAMKARTIDPEARLPPKIQVADHLYRVLEFQMRGLFVLAAVAAAAIGQRPMHRKAVTIVHALVTADRHPFGQIHLKRNAGHDAVLGKKVSVLAADATTPSQDGRILTSPRKAEITRGSHLRPD